MNRVNHFRIQFATTVLWMLFCVLNVNGIHAQTIIDDLQSQTNASGGVIHIECDSSIIALIGKPNRQLAANSAIDFVERNGFRIQAFMGTDQNARSEANAKQEIIRNAFPELFTYVRYEAPNWKLLVGDFISREEAATYLQRLQKEFPKFGKEMYIVQERIRLFIQR